MNKPKKGDVQKPHTKPKPKSSNPKANQDTSWGGVADWYDKHLEGGEDTYHAQVVFPNLIRLLGDVKEKHVLDLACGQGIFSRLLKQGKAEVTGVDIARELIDIAEKKNRTEHISIRYFATPSDDLYMIKNKTQDVVVCILALQNIEKLQDTLKEVSRILKKGGKFLFVLNHPCFRIPKVSSWGYDEHTKTQYRRLDEYMSESKVKIDMTPGTEKNKKYTVSFHRPLQVYIKALAKHGFAITKLEEWQSHKESEKGPRQEAENKSRKEIPLFLCIEAVQL